MTTETSLRVTAVGLSRGSSPAMAVFRQVHSLPSSLGHAHVYGDSVWVANSHPGAMEVMALLMERAFPFIHLAYAFIQSHGQVEH